MLHRLLPSRRSTLLAALSALLYVVLDWELRAAALPSSGIIPWYLSAGVGFAAVLTLGLPGFIALVAARAFVVMGLSGLRGDLLLPSLFPCVVYGGVGWVLRWHLRRTGDLWRFSSTAVLLSGIIASAVASAAFAELWTGGPTNWTEFATFAAGDAIGSLIIVPLALFVLSPLSRNGIAVSDGTTGGGNRSWRTVGWKSFELGLAGAALVVAVAFTWVSAVSGSRLGGYEWAIAFLTVFWISQRGGLEAASLAFSVIGAGWILLSEITGRYPLAVGTSQSLLLSVGVLALVTGAARTGAEEDAGHYWGLFLSAREGIWRLDDEGRTLYVNDRMAEMLQRAPAEIVGRSAREFIAPERLDDWLRRRENRARGEAETYETQLVRRDGSRAVVLVSATAVSSTVTRRLVGSVALVTDVTELRQLEARQRQAQQLLEAAFRSARDALILFRADDELIVDVNDVWCAVTGYRREEVIGRSQKALKLWGDPADSARLAAAVREHGFVRDFEISFTRHEPDGSLSRGYAVLSAQPIVADGVDYLLVSGRDVTAEKRDAESRMHQQRLEELGRLAGSVAHDFNNLLTVAMAHTEMARAEIGDQPAALADIDEAYRALTRSAGLTKRLLAFSRRQPSALRPVDLGDAVRNAAGMLRTILGATIALEFEIDGEAPPILADPSQLDQILLNLAVNARDAMPAGGVFRVHVGAVTAAAGDVERLIGRDAIPGTYVEMRVTDTGVGMDETTRRQLFEPFFTTKAAGQGTGLGLAVVAGIVRQSRGAIRVTSAPHHGATFHLFFPAAAMAPMPSDLEPTLYRPTTHETGTRVLLVEDDTSVREILCRALEDQGYVVITSTDGRKAIGCLEELEAAQKLPAVVLSDVVMPVVDGHALVEFMAERYPGIPVVLMTGHGESRPPAGSRGRAPMLYKPFPVSELLRALESAQKPSV